MNALQQNPAPDFNQLLLAQLDALYRTAHYLTGDPALAEDLVQEVAVKAIRAQATFQRGAEFRPWIFTILRHALSDYYRQQDSHLLSVSLDDDELELVAEEAPDMNLFDHALDEEVTQALAELPAEMRLAVLLADVEGFSYRDIAAILGWPLGSVMSRLYRGRQKLRQRLLTYAKKWGYAR